MMNNIPTKYCEYCCPNNSYGNEGLSKLLFIANEKLILLDIQSGTSEHIEINFCPMCGRLMNLDI